MSARFTAKPEGLIFGLPVIHLGPQQETGLFIATECESHPDGIPRVAIITLVQGERSLMVSMNLATAMRVRKALDEAITRVGLAIEFNGTIQ